MNVMAIIKEHPVPVGIGVVVILLLIISSRNSSSSSGSGAASYLQAQQIATSSNTQMAAINSQASIALGAQSVDRYKIAESAAIERTNIVGNIFATMTGTNAQVTMNNSNNLFKSLQSGYAHAENMDQLDKNFIVQQQAISGNIKMFGDKLSADQTALVTNVNATLNALGQTQAYTERNMPTLLQHSENMAKIAGSNQLAIVTRQTEAANTSADASKNKSDWGIVSDIGKIVLSLFAL